MRIAQIAPLSESVPPSHYGGTERVVSWLSDELIGLGDMSRCLQAAARKPRPSCCGFAQTVAAEPSADRVGVPAPGPGIIEPCLPSPGPASSTDSERNIERPDGVRVSAYGWRVRLTGSASALTSSGPVQTGFSASLSMDYTG